MQRRHGCVCTAGKNRGTLGRIVQPGCTPIKAGGVTELEHCAECSEEEIGETALGA